MDHTNRQDTIPLLYHWSLSQTRNALPDNRYTYAYFHNTSPNILYYRNVYITDKGLLQSHIPSHPGRRRCGYMALYTGCARTLNLVRHKYPEPIFYIFFLHPTQKIPHEPSIVRPLYILCAPNVGNRKDDRNANYKAWYV